MQNRGMTTNHTNTQRLEADIAASAKRGDGSIHFYVGRHTGNGPSVLNALRRRGYVVQHAAGGGYTARAKTTTP